MKDEDYKAICRLLQEHSGIVLEPGKEYLVKGRLAPLVQQLKLKSISELVAQVRSRPDNGLCRQIVEAMLTSETSFFRDQRCFEELRKAVIPDLIRRRSGERRLHFWCAASATGQEPYSLAMILREHGAELAGWDVSILASDLARDLLERARLGRYKQIEIERGLSKELRAKYFKHHGSDWQLKPEIRSMVEFREINLSRPWPALPRMDLILMRNVMIYFDVPMKKTILTKLARLLRQDGYLLLGGAETTLNLDESYRRAEHLKYGFYQWIGK